MALTGVTNRKYLSDVVLESEQDGTADKSFQRVTVKSPAGAGDITLDPIGQAVIYGGATGEFVLMQDTDTVPASGDPRIIGTPTVGILVGDAWAAGKNDADLTVTEAGVTAHVYTGYGVVVNEGIEFDAVSGGDMSAERGAFLDAIFGQNTVVKDRAEQVTPSYTA